MSKEALYKDIGMYFNEEFQEWRRGNRFIKLNPDGTIEANWYDVSWDERQARIQEAKDRPVPEGKPTGNRLTEEGNVVDKDDNFLYKYDGHCW